MEKNNKRFRFINGYKKCGRVDNGNKFLLLKKNQLIESNIGGLVNVNTIKPELNHLENNLQHLISIGIEYRRPVYFKELVDIYTGEIKMYNNVDEIKWKRNEILEIFKQTYLDGFRVKFSIMALVLTFKNKSDKKEFIPLLLKLLSHNKITILGYFWINDYDSGKSKRHIHWLIATKYINGQMKTTFRDKNHREYNVELVNDLEAKIGYLQKKEVFYADGERSYAKTNQFKLS